MIKSGERKQIRDRIGKKVKKQDGLYIYLCMDCGIIEYEPSIIRGGKKCPGGCGYLMDNEEQD